MSLTELRGVPGEAKPPVTINPITKEPTKYYDSLGLYGPKGVGLVYHTIPKGKNGRYKLRHRY